MRRAVGCAGDELGQLHHRPDHRFCLPRPSDKAPTPSHPVQTGLASTGPVADSGFRVVEVVVGAPLNTLLVKTGNNVRLWKNGLVGDVGHTQSTAPSF